MLASATLPATSLIHGRFPAPLVIPGFVATGAVLGARFGGTTLATIVQTAPEALAPDHHGVVGAGFAGLKLAHDLCGTPVRITIVDQRNHPLFQPLLYQVATTLLATSEIAWPIQRLFRDRPEATTLLGRVRGVVRQRRRCR